MDKKEFQKGNGQELNDKKVKLSFIEVFTLLIVIAFAIISFIFSLLSILEH